MTLLTTTPRLASASGHWLFVIKVVVLSTHWLLQGTSQADADDPYALLRDQLVRQRIESAGVTDPRVLDAIRSTPRHEFVPASERDRAYYDMALPIGSAQTISSPFIVASMTEALDPQPTDKVLEIGTGSGYQAAVLSPLVQHVYSIEIVEELGLQAERTLKHLDYDNVSVRVGDGFLGWPNAAPFDKIIVTCSPESVPRPLVEQLAEGGQIVVPVGERYQQTLYRMTKKDGELVREPLRPTLFVPMTGKAEDARIRKPDAANPEVINGDFRLRGKESPSNQASGNSQGSDGLSSDGLGGSRIENGQTDDFVPGWYYGRQVNQVTQQGETFVRFANDTPGLSSHLLQGIAIDGKQVSLIRLSGRCRTENVKIGPTKDAIPMVAISFYDELRQDLGIFWLGPFRGTRPWREASRLIRIPAKTKEAIVRIGLFGATGMADFDQIRIEKVD